MVDFGLLRSDTFSYEEHIHSYMWVNKAAKNADLVSKAFSTRNTAFLLHVFNLYIRPILDYVSPVWSSSDIAHCTASANMQRRYKRPIDGLRSMTYDQRLAELGLLCLAKHRHYLDTVLTYKNLHGLVSLPHEAFGLHLPQAKTKAGG